MDIMSGEDFKKRFDGDGPFYKILKSDSKKEPVCHKGLVKIDWPFHPNRDFSTTIEFINLDMLCKSHDHSGSRYGIWGGDQIAFVEIPDDAQVAVSCFKTDRVVITEIVDLNSFRVQDQSLAYRYVKNSGCAIRFVENPSDSLKRLAIENATCPYTLSFISWGSNPPSNIDLRSMLPPSPPTSRGSGGRGAPPISRGSGGRGASNAVDFVNNVTSPLTDEMVLEAIRHNGENISYAETQTDDMKWACLKHGGYYIRYIVDPTREMQLEAVTQSYKYIKEIENPTEEVVEYVNHYLKTVLGRKYSYNGQPL